MMSNFLTITISRRARLLGACLVGSCFLVSFHYRILRHRFPLDEYRGRIERKRYYDSLIRVYPQLLSPAYFQYLLKKAIDPHAEPFAYYERIFPITDSQYRYLANLIDSSGYWSLPYTLDCKPENRTAEMTS
jgi:hypothetical protein